MQAQPWPKEHSPAVVKPFLFPQRAAVNNARMEKIFTTLWPATARVMIFQFATDTQNKHLESWFSSWGREGGGGGQAELSQEWVQGESLVDSKWTSVSSAQLWITPHTLSAVGCQKIEMNRRCSFTFFAFCFPQIAVSDVYQRSQLWKSSSFSSSLLKPHSKSAELKSFAFHLLGRKKKREEETEPPHTALSPASYVLTPHRMKCKTNGQPVTGPAHWHPFNFWRTVAKKLQSFRSELTWTDLLVPAPLLLISTQHPDWIRCYSRVSWMPGLSLSSST